MAEFPRNNSGFEEISSTSRPRNDKLTLTAQECSSTSLSEVYLSGSMMTKHFLKGESKVLLGKDGLRTACTLLTDPALNDNDVPDDKIKINSVIRRKLHVSVGDSVTILKDESIPLGRTVCVRPLEECAQDLESVNLFEAYLRPIFKDALRPVHTGDLFSVTRNGRRINFRITNVDPSPFCTVGPGTRIRCKSFKSGELEKVKSMKRVLPAPIKEEPDDSEPEVTILKVVSGQKHRWLNIFPKIKAARAAIGRVKNNEAGKELEQNGNKHIPNAVASSFKNGVTGSSQFNGNQGRTLQKEFAEIPNGPPPVSHTLRVRELGAPSSSVDPQIDQPVKCKFPGSKRSQSAPDDKPDSIKRKHNGSGNMDQSKRQSAKEDIHEVKPKPTELPGCSQPPRNSAEVQVVVAGEKSSDCGQGTINDPAVVQHQNPRLQSTLKEDLEVLSFQHQRALSLFYKTKFAESASEFKKVVSKRTFLLGPHHVDTLRSHYFVGRCLFKQQKVSEAIQILDHVLKIQKLVLPADDGNIEETEFAIARCFHVLEKYPEEEALYRILYDKTKRRLGPNHKNTLITQYNLAYALDKQNKFDDAMKYYGAFVALGVEYLGPGNECVVYAQERIKHLQKSHMKSQNSGR